MEVSMGINEAARLNTLHKYNILDTAPERAFDDINRLAAHICGTPIALISLIDHTRQWFKSKIGLAASEITRDKSFCTYTIQRAELVVIQDTLADERFATNPWVTSDSNIRFYAGMPLITPEGYALGTLCVMDCVPRKLSLEQEEILGALSRQVVTQLELRRKLFERQRMEEALHQAYNKLEVRVEERTTELRRVNERLQGEIVERQRLETQLLRREQELSDFFENGAIGLHWVGPDGTVLWANQAELDLLGYSREEYIGHHIANFHADQAVIEDILQRLTAQETLNDYEARLLCKDGSIRYVLIDSNVFWEEGQFIHTRCFTRDITERKRAEELLLERSRLAALEADVGVSLTRSNTLQDILQQCTEALVRHLDAAFARIWTLNTSENVLELQASAGIYSRIDGDYSQIPVGQFKIGLIAQSRQPHLTNSVIGDPRIHDQAWAVREGMVAFAGYPLVVEEQLVGVMAIFARQLLPEATLEAMTSVASAIGLGIQRKQATEALHQAYAELEIRVAERTIDLRNANEQLQLEIAERQRAEEVLRQSEEQFRSLSACSPVGIFMADVNGHCTYTNPRSQAICGFTFEEALGEGYAQSIHPGDREWVLADWSAGVAKGQEHSLEYRFLTKEGLVHWVHARSAPMFSDTGELIGHVGTIEDITERKQAVEALHQAHAELEIRVVERTIDLRNANEQLQLEIAERQQAEKVLQQSEEQFRSLSACSPLGIFMTDTEGRCTYTNPRCQAICGFTFEEALGVGWAQSLYPDHREWAFADWSAYAQGGREYSDEFRFQTKEGIVHWTHVRSSPMFSDKGELIGHVGTVEDITERKQVEAALQESEAKFRSLVEQSSDWIWEIDRNGVFTYVSPKVSEIVGYAAAELLSKTTFDLMTPEKRQRFMALLEPFFLAQKPFTRLEKTLIHKDGNPVVLETSGSPIFDCQGVLQGYRGIARDISERKQAEQALQASEARLQAILDSSTAVIYMMDTQNRYMLINRQYEELFHTTQAQIAGQTIDECWPKKVADALVANNWEVLAAGTAVEFEETVPHDDGLHTYITNKVPVYDSSGTPYAVCGVSTDITDRKQAEVALRESEERYRRLVDLSPEAILVYSDGKVVYCNPAGAKLYRAASPEAMVGQSAWNFVHPDYRALVAERVEQSEATGEPTRPLEVKVVRLDGEIIDAESVGVPIIYEGKPARQVLVRDISDRKRVEAALQQARDQLEIRVQERTRELAKANEALQKEIAERKLIEQELLHSNERFQLAASAVNCVIYDWDIQRNTVERTAAGLLNVLGYSPQEAQPTTNWWKSRVHPDDRQHTCQQVWSALANNGSDFAVEYRIRHRSNQYRYVWDKGIIVRNSDGQAIRVVGSFLDISDRKQVEDQLLHDALHDQLTGLSNRALFMDRLAWVLEYAKRHVDYLFAVLFLDLDRFKVVNDSLGHTIGDQLLIAIAGRLQVCLRPSDTIARLGGDEFTILLSDIKDVREVTRVADRIHKQLAAPFNLNGYEVFTTASIGIALSKTDYDRPEELLRDADIAMYRAKTLGKARYALFGEDMHTSAVARLQLEMDLRRAIERQEFQLHYQPIVSLETGRITGFEALLRWQHPNRGLISPAEFISVTEETGLIIPIGQWVLREACSQMHEWRRQLPTLPLTINVNLSGKQFTQPDLVEQIKQVLQETDLEACNLGLEITECVIMENTEAVSSTLFELRALGIQLHMDDFGTGYSSLSYLHRFPMDVLKIDRTFISRIGASAKNLEIVRTIVMLAHSLGMKVTAEGVETEEQLAQIRALKCEYGQGYFFSKPINSKMAKTLIAEGLKWRGQ